MEVFTPAIKLEHSDARGEIYSITLPNDQELMLLHSKAGSIRGGHSHDVDEIVVLLTGKLEYSKKADIKSWESHRTLSAGYASFNPAGEYHMAEFLEDSWLLEWKIATNKAGWKNIDYAPWRERVKANAATHIR